MTNQPQQPCPHLRVLGKTEPGGGFVYHCEDCGEPWAGGVYTTTFPPAVAATASAPALSPEQRAEHAWDCFLPKDPPYSLAARHEAFIAGYLAALKERP